MGNYIEDLSFHQSEYQSTRQFETIWIVTFCFTWILSVGNMLLSFKNFFWGFTLLLCLLLSWTTVIDSDVKLRREDQILFTLLCSAVIGISVSVCVILWMGWRRNSCRRCNSVTATAEDASEKSLHLWGVIYVLFFIQLVRVIIFLKAQ